MAAMRIKRAARAFLKRKREGKVPPRKRKPQRQLVAGGTGAANGSFMSDMGMSDVGFGPENTGHIVNVPGNVDVHRVENSLS